MTAPAPVPPPTGQSTLDEIIEYLEEIAKAIDPGILPAIESVVAALQTVSSIIDPAAGKEVEREATLAALFRAKDANGLLAYKNTVPAHPNKSLAICSNYLTMLAAQGIVPTPITQ